LRIEFRRYFAILSILGSFSGSTARADLALPSELLPIQTRLFQEAFSSFVRDFGGAHPELALEQATIVAPAFDPKLSRSDWIDAFADQVALSIHAANADKLKSDARDMFTSYYHDQGYARVSYLEAVAPEKLAGSSAGVTSTPVALPSAFPSPHTLDVPTYVAERFPIALQEFVSAHSVPLYIDHSNCADAYAYQATQGFTRAVRFMGDRDSPDSQYLFVENPDFGSYRFVVCDINGNDDETRIVAMLGPIFFKAGASSVRHAHPSPLFDWTEEGAALSLDPERDQVVIGFQNTVWWQLTTAPDGNVWQRSSLTRSGIDVALFVRTDTHQAVLSIENVYGDEMVEALTTLYAKGARKFVYMGTAGALDPALKIGDVLIPQRFLKPDGSWVPFTNGALSMGLALDSGAQVLAGSAQGWVGTLIEETVAHVQDLRTQGAQAIDVETRYFAEFFASHESREKAIVLVVSDTPLGSLNYDKENETRAIPMESITSLLPRILWPGKTP
jgi:hypothetical protein